MMVVVGAYSRGRGLLKICSSRVVGLFEGGHFDGGQFED